jgi:PAS domain S-box-containing protein
MGADARYRSGDLGLSDDLLAGISPRDIPAEPRGKLKVLIVDDDISLCDSLAALLRVVEYDVVNVYCAEDALEAAWSEEFNAAILDVNLPDRGGLEVLEKLRENPEMAILMLSGSVTLEQAVEALNRGADAFVIKPAKPEVLLSNLTKAIRLKGLEKELKVSEARYRELFENIGDGVFQLDMEGNYTAINRAGAEIFGFSSPDDVLHGRLKFWDTHASRDASDEFLEQVMGEGEVVRVLRRFRALNGSLGWLETTVRTRLDERGKVTGFEGIFRDITDRIRYQEMLEALYCLWEDLGDVTTIEEIGSLTLKFVSVMLEIDEGGFNIIEGTVLRQACEGIGGIEPKERPLKGKSIAAEAARTGESVLKPNSKDGEESKLAVPVKVRDKVVAVIEIGRRDAGAFSEDDRKLVEIIAECVGSVIGRLISSKFGLKPDYNLRDYL